MTMRAFSSLDEAFGLSGRGDRAAFLLDLTRLCGEGSIQATGVKNGVGRSRVEIPPLEFDGRRLSFIFGGSLIPDSWSESFECEIARPSIFEGQSPLVRLHDVVLSPDAEPVVWVGVHVLTKAVSQAFSQSEETTQINSPSDEDVLDLIHGEVAKHGGFISQKNGAKIVRTKYPGFNKEHAMALVKRVTGNKIPGPKGPRK